MKKLLHILVLPLLVMSCGPSRHAISLEMRHPSKSGIDLSGKIVSVIYLDGKDARNDIVSENIAEAFARSLEEDYGTGQGSVGIYAVDGASGKYAERDSLFSILMKTGADLVFLLDVQETGGRVGAGVPVKVNLFCYDGMDAEDKVKTFTGNTALSAASDADLIAAASKAGKQISESFAPQWKHEQYSIAYYDSAKWYDALEKAEQYDWKGAMDIWFSLLDAKDPLKRACAEFNIATACYLMGDFKLSEEWLDRSDADNKIPTLSDALRKRLELRK